MAAPIEYTIDVPHNYTPRSYQLPFLRAMGSGIRRAVKCWHRRAGKDKTDLNFTIKRMFPESVGGRVGTYFHLFPTYAQGKRVIWDERDYSGFRVLDHFPKPFVESYNETELQVKLKNGSIYQIVGTDRLDPIIGTNPVGVVYSEFSLQDPMAKQLIDPILSENDGWAVFNFTPRGHNHAKELFDMAMGNPEWFCERLTVDQTFLPNGIPVISKQEIDRRRSEGTSEDVIQQEYYCFTPDTEILCSDGMKPICNVAPGDWVMTHTGRWQKVKKLLRRQYAGKIVVIKSYGGGDPLKATPNHPVRVLNKAEQSYSWKQAGRITKRDFLVMPRLMNGSSIIEDDLVKLIGFYVTEGSHTRNAVQFTLGSHEKELQTELETVFVKLGRRHSKVEMNNAVQYHVPDTKLVDFLKTHCGSLAANKRSPLTLIAGKEQILFETMMKGDGCLAKTKGRNFYAYTTVSRHLAYQVQLLAHALGFRAGISKRAAQLDAVINGRPINSQDSYSVQIRIDPITYNKYQQTTKIAPARHGVGALVKSVETVDYVGQVFNLSVDQDESYVANGRIVHNCSFEGFQEGSIFGAEMITAEKDGRICDVPYNPNFPVYTFWDLGFADMTAIWFFQVVGPGINVIDYHEDRRKGIPEYARVLRNDKPYMYGRHFWPWDAEHHESDGQTKKEKAEALGVRPIDVVKRGGKNEGIDQARMLITRCRFDRNKTARGRDALASYTYEYDHIKKEYKHGYPTHNWACFTGDTEVLTRFGTYPIMNLPKNGEVLTPFGYKHYQNPRLTKRNAQLVEVRFKDGYTVRCTPDHLFLTVNGWRSAESLNPNTLIQSSLIPSRNISMADYIDYFRNPIDIFPGAVNTFIEQFGLSLLEKFQMAVIFIIKIMTELITRYQILSAFHPMIICPITGENLLRQVRRGRFHKKLAMPPPYGIDRTPEDCGIVGMLGVLAHGLSGNVSPNRAQSVGLSSGRSFAIADIRKSIARRVANHCLIERVSPVAIRADVWDITVPDEACFSLANGAVVHNSHGSDAFRTAAMSDFERIASRRAGPISVETVFDPFNIKDYDAGAEVESKFDVFRP